MKRTQVFLQDEQASSIDLLARIQKKPQAQIIREAINYGLSVLHKKATDKPESALLTGKLAIAGLAPDISSRIDDILYGGTE
jgi:hypothetical protein